MLVIFKDVKNYNYKVAICLRYLHVNKKEREENKETADFASESIK